MTGSTRWETKTQRSIMGNSNEITTIDKDSTMDPAIGKLLQDTNDDRRTQFVLYWLCGLSVTAAGVKAGYSKQYSASGLHRAFKHGPNIRKKISELSAKLPERYREISRLQLIELASAEGLAVKEYLKDPKLLIDKPALAKQIKQSAGVLADEGDPGVVPLVNINFEVIQAMVADSLKRD